MTAAGHKAAGNQCHQSAMIPWYPDKPTAYTSIRKYLLSACTRWVPGPKRALRVR
tara:strand:- start:7220 stop:7384 length:165 start_codon:yes stop_codon:yes gene_type:complete